MRARAIPLLLCLAACERAEPPAPAPAAEFIIAAADSVFWVRSDDEGIRVRGAPMVLAQVGGRFAELYLADIDHSFYDAVFVSQQLFKRDLVSGDSVMLFADTLVPMLARGYAAANPDERPLDEDEQGSENPRTIATADVIVLDVHGPWLSYEYRTDVDVIGGISSHGARRGVIDLRTAAPTTLEALIGTGPARRLVSAGRERWRMMRDSMRLIAADAGEESLAAIDRLSFDPRSFILGVQDRDPRVRFAVTLAGAIEPGGVVELDPVAVEEQVWWEQVRQSHPIEEGFDERTWPRDGFTLVARPAQGPSARMSFALRDEAGSEWRLGSVPSPVLRVMWLGDSTETPGTRQALTRAFNEAAFYSGDVRIVRHRPRPGPDARPLVRHAARQVAPGAPVRRLPAARAAKPIRPRA